MNEMAELERQARIANAKFPALEAIFQHPTAYIYITFIAFILGMVVFTMKNGKNRGKDKTFSVFWGAVYGMFYTTVLIAPVVAWLFSWLYTPYGFFSSIITINTFLTAIAYLLTGSGVVLVLMMFQFSPATSIKKTRTLENGGNLTEVLPVTTDKKDSVLVAYGEPLNAQKLGEFNENRKAMRVSAADRVLCLGVPGSGKTAYLVAQIIDWMSTGQSLVVTDIKPEIWARLHENGIFKKFGYKVYVFNPTNPEAHKYNLFDEFSTVAELSEIMEVVIPQAQGEGEQFNKNARRVLTAVILHLGDKASLPAARQFIRKAGTIAQLLTFLENSESETVQSIASEVRHTADNERLMASIMTALLQAFRFFDDEVIRNAIASSGFLLKDVLKQPKTAVFFQFEQETGETTAPLFGATVYRALKVLQKNYNEREGLNVLVLLDEIINSAPIPSFIKMLNTLRSANAPVWLYMQNLETLNDLYGSKAADQFLAATNMHMSFRITSIETAKVLSQEVGKAETIYTSSSAQTVDRTGRGSDYSVSRSSQLNAVIEPEEILSFPDHTALVFYRGKAGTLNMPIYFKDFPMPNRSALERPSAADLS